VRSSQPSLGRLARLVSQAYVGGTLSDKAGVTHFHVGPARDRLAQLHALLDEHEVLARQLYPTHVNRSAALMDEAIALAARGAYVDVDTVDGGVGRWLHYYRAHGGALDRLTVSSDAHTPGGSPGQYYANLVASVHEYGLPLAEVLPSFTRNVAQALRLPTKGELREGMDGDVVVVARETLTVVHVFARGR
jgi:beta-aspartyl-dipeptidase (metallo-type)